MKFLPNFIRRFPFTIFLLVGMIIAAMVTHTYFDHITPEWLNLVGFSPNDLWYWRLERMFTSAWVTLGGCTFLGAILLVSLIVGLTEWMTGWLRTAFTFWSVHLLTLVLLTLVVFLLEHQFHAIGLEASVTTRDVGPSAGYFACLGLVSARLKRPWQWVSAGILLATLVIFLLTPAIFGDNANIKFSADLAHLLAFPLGWISAGLGLKHGSLTRCE